LQDHQMKPMQVSRMVRAALLNVFIMK